MRAQLLDFWNDESGAATVDWVVMTAASVGLGVAVMGEISDGIENLAQDIDTVLRQDIIRTSFDAVEPNEDDPD